MEIAAQIQPINCKISRLSELRGIKQEAPVAEPGMSRPSVSRMESSETVEDALPEKIGVVLGVSPEAIKNFNEEAVFNIISNTYHNTSNENSTLISSSVNYQPTFNTIEKIVELYERLVQAEKDRADALERLLGEK